jgi:hypothetical protein
VQNFIQKNNIRFWLLDRSAFPQTTQSIKLAFNPLDR